MKQGVQATARAVSRLRGSDPSPYQSTWDLWWMKCHWNRFFSYHLNFSLSISFTSASQSFIFVSLTIHLSYCLHFKEKHGKRRQSEGGVIAGKTYSYFSACCGNWSYSWSFLTSALEESSCYIHACVALTSEKDSPVFTDCKAWRASEPVCRF